MLTFEEILLISVIVSCISTIAIIIVALYFDVRLTRFEVSIEKEVNKVSNTAKTFKSNIANMIKSGVMLHKKKMTSTMIVITITIGFLS